MKEDGFPLTNLSDFRDGKEHTSFVVRPHHRNQRGLGANRGLQFGEIDIAMSINAKKRYGAAVFFEVLGWAQNSAVFHGACHDMFSVRLKLQRGMNDRIIEVPSVGGKIYFPTRAAD